MGSGGGLSLGPHEGGLVVDCDRLWAGCDCLGAGTIDDDNLQTGDQSCARGSRCCLRSARRQKPLVA